MLPFVIIQIQTFIKTLSKRFIKTSNFIYIMLGLSQRSRVIFLRNRDLYLAYLNI